MIKLKPITERSWLVLTDAMDRVGILSEQHDKLVLLIKDGKTIFKNRSEIVEFFNEDIFDNIVVDHKKEVKEYFVSGFPADADNPHEPDVEHELPIYSKTETSETYYAAGYYCINFPKGWLTAFCPKAQTLTKYGYDGPYKTESDMKLAYAKLRRKVNV